MSVPPAMPASQRALAIFVMKHIEFAPLVEYVGRGGGEPYGPELQPLKDDLERRWAEECERTRQGGVA